MYIFSILAGFQNDECVRDLYRRGRMDQIGCNGQEVLRNMEFIRFPQVRDLVSFISSSQIQSRSQPQSSTTTASSDRHPVTITISFIKKYVLIFRISYHLFPISVPYSACLHAFQLFLIYFPQILFPYPCQAKVLNFLCVQLFIWAGKDITHKSNTAFLIISNLIGHSQKKK